MSCEDDVLGIGKNLEKMISKETTDHVSAVDMLKTLQDLPMTLDVLQKTRIGMVVNNFRKSSTNEEAVSLSKSLIKSWKKLLPEGSQASTKSNGSKTNESLDKRQDSIDSYQDSPVLEKSDSLQPSKYSGTSNPVRLKCQELLANALKVDPMPDGAKDLEELSSGIEESIYELFLNTDSKYKNRVRSRVANLKDSKNPLLRLNVLTGLIDPSRLAAMTAVEMASEDMKELRAKLTKEAIDDHQMAMQAGTQTSLLSCSRCKKSNCTYNQVQTRSADEPMTTFVFCNECGKRWKFC